MAEEKIRRLEGKVAIITGAATGIGRAVSLLFAEEGAKLMLIDRNEEALNETMNLIPDEHEDVMGRKGDVSNEEEVKLLVDETLEHYSTIDIVCNNAGIVGSLDLPTDQDTRKWLEVFNVNVLGAVLMTKYVVKHMQAQRSGSIVNTAPIDGIRPGSGGRAYSAGKGALINFTRISACDLGMYNIRINAVCPGLIDSGMPMPFYDLARDKGKEELKRYGTSDKVADAILAMAFDLVGKENEKQTTGPHCDLRRYGTPEEVAAAILFLAGDEASYITGQVLTVDGGHTSSINIPNRHS